MSLDSIVYVDILWSSHPTASHVRVKVLGVMLLYL